MKILAAVIAAIAIPAIFVAGDSFAASQSFTYTSSNFPGGRIWSSDNNYNDELSFTPTYLLVEVQLPPADPYSPVKIFDLKPASISSWSSSYCAPDSSGYCSFLTNVAWGVRWQSPNNGNFTSVKYTWYDFNPASSEPCPDCPEIPELPYGEKLDHLTAAIIFVPATMLVLYFMFAIYSMFFRGLK